VSSASTSTSASATPLVPSSTPENSQNLKDLDQGVLQLAAIILAGGAV
jgi:hypothetical protein